jgi:hypothetical protein
MSEINNTSLINLPRKRNTTNRKSKVLGGLDKGEKRYVE